MPRRERVRRLWKNMLTSLFVNAHLVDDLGIMSCGAVKEIAEYDDGGFAVDETA